MEKSSLKRSSTESSENGGGDSVFHQKRARKEEGSQEDAIYSQNTQEYELLEPPTQGETTACSQNNDHGGAGQSSASQSSQDKSDAVGDVASETGTVVISEESQGIDKDGSGVDGDAPTLSVSQETGDHGGSEVDPANRTVVEERKGDAAQLNDVDAASVAPRLKWKDTSLIGDADTVKCIIPSASEKLIFDTLAKHRANPDRLNIVTTTVLDSDSNAAAGGDTGHGDQHQTATGLNLGDTDAGSSHGSSVDGTMNVYEDAKRVVEKVKATHPHIQINAAHVCALLENHKHQADRISHVADILTQKGEASKSNSAADDDIFTQAMKLKAEFQQVDPSEIYNLLEKAADPATRFQDVRAALVKKRGDGKNGGAKKPPALLKNDSWPDDPLVRNDPVYRDMRIISKMFPEKDQNEIYALVEAHYYKPLRVQVVIEELLRSGQGSQGDGDTSSLSHSQSFNVPAGTSVDPQSTPKPGVSDLQDDVDHLREIFPDCDPNYIYERLEANKSSADRVKNLASEMFERRDYPRLKDVMDKYSKEAQKRNLQQLDISFDDFLAKFPDPFTHFHAEDKEMRESYKAHALVALQHDYPLAKAGYIRSMLVEHNFHYLPTFLAIEGDLECDREHRTRTKKLRRNPRTKLPPYPDLPDEYFFYEHWYNKHEYAMEEYVKQKKEAREAKLEAARANNELYECGCCFEDECLFEEMNACADGHLFCRQCIARSAEAAFGEGKTTFPCLTGTCEHQFPLSVLKEVLTSAVFSKVLRKMQEEEVRQAGIPDLVDCPFCSFATIMDNPDDRVFRCLNPECLKDSCRLCREPNHVPLRCEEVEKQNETDMRTFIEKRVTEAMIRKCHHCGKRFVKDAGCNKMTCICGATSCYICREPDIDYNHFNNNRCHEGDMEAVHRREMEEAATKAKEEYLRDHPEAADINLKYDPLQHLDMGTADGGMFAGGYDDDEGHSDDNDAESIPSDASSYSSDVTDYDDW